MAFPLSFWSTNCYFLHNMIYFSKEKKINKHKLYLKLLQAKHAKNKNWHIFSYFTCKDKHAVKKVLKCISL